MKEMSVVEFLVHLVAWLAAVVGMFTVWNFADNADRILAAPEVSAIANGLATILCGAIILIDLHKNGTRLKEFLEDILDAALCVADEIQEDNKRRHSQQRRKAHKLGRTGLRREPHPNLPEDFFGADE